MVKLKPQKGVAISVSKRDAWAEDAVEYLLTHPDEYFMYHSSGDSIVFATLTLDGELCVYDAKVRRYQGFHVDTKRFIK